MNKTKPEMSATVSGYKSAAAEYAEIIMSLNTGRGCGDLYMPIVSRWDFDKAETAAEAAARFLGSVAAKVERAQTLLTDINIYIAGGALIEVEAWELANGEYLMQRVKERSAQRTSTVDEA